MRRASDSPVPIDAGIEPRTVEKNICTDSQTLHLNHSARSHPYTVRRNALYGDVVRYQSFHQQAKKIMKNLDLNCFCDFLIACYLWGRIYSKCNYSKNCNKQKKMGKNLFFVGNLKAIDEKSRIRIRNPLYGSKDPSPSENVTDPEHCCEDPSSLWAWGGGPHVCSVLRYTTHSSFLLWPSFRFIPVLLSYFYITKPWFSFRKSLK